MPSWCFSRKIGRDFASSQVETGSRERLWNYLECWCSSSRCLLWMVELSLLFSRRLRSSSLQAVNLEQHLSVCLRQPSCRRGRCRPFSTAVLIGWSVCTRCKNLEKSRPCRQKWGGRGVAFFLQCGISILSKMYPCLVSNLNNTNKTSI